MNTMILINVLFSGEIALWIYLSVYITSFGDAMHLLSTILFS